MITLCLYNTSYSYSQLCILCGFWSYCVIYCVVQHTLTKAYSQFKQYYQPITTNQHYHYIQHSLSITTIPYTETQLINGNRTTCSKQNKHLHIKYLYIYSPQCPGGCGRSKGLPFANTNNIQNHKKVITFLISHSNNYLYTNFIQLLPQRLVSLKPKF